MQKDQEINRTISDDTTNTATKKEKAAKFAKGVAQASIQEGVPVMKEVLGGTVKASLGIAAATLRIFKR